MKKTLRILTVFMCIIVLTGSLGLTNLTVNAAQVLPLVGFEDRKTQGFYGHGGNEKLTITNAESHSGSKSLLVSKRTQNWNGAAIRAEKYAEPNNEYEINVWVLPKSSEMNNYLITASIGNGSNTKYYTIYAKTISNKDGWTLLSGKFTFGDKASIDSAVIYIESSSNNAEYYIDDFLIKKVEYNNIRVPSLYQRYKDYFLLGTVFSSTRGPYFDVIKWHFNALTAGNAMKPMSLSMQKGVYDFADIDKMVSDILAADITLHGHTLAWHEQLSPWLIRDSNGKTLTRAEALINMTNYVNAVAGHFKGKVYSWDVLNEAIRNGLGDVQSNWKDGLWQDSPWYKAFENGAKEGESGADYVETLYRLARKADPNAKLYYNDYNLNEQNKAAAVAKMVKSINDKYLAEGNNRLLIEGVGMQGHYYLNTNPDDVERSIKRFINIGVEVSISELDISLFGWEQTGTPTEDLYKKQAEIYAKLFKIFMKYSDNIKRVTFWGMDDMTSWISGNYPLLFDKDLNPKLAYFAVYDPNGYLAGKYDTNKQRDAWIKSNTPILKSVVDKKVKTLKGVTSTQFTLDTVSKTGQKSVKYNTKYAGKTVKLYRYDSAENKFYSVCTVKIKTDGTCTYTGIKKTGDYLAVVV